MGWVRSNKKGSGSGARYGLYPLKEIDLIPEAQVDDTNIIYSGYDFGGYPYRAFDKTGSGWVSNQTTTPRARYIGFKFTEPVLCNGLKLDYNNPGSYFSSQRPAVYTIQGSNDDGTTWTDIYTDGWNPSDTGSMVSRKITFENFDEYKWYRIAIDASGGDGYCIINEITFYKVVYGQIEIQSASGSLVNFTTSLALPLVALKTNIVAQGGGGTPSAPVAITGFDSVKIYQRGINLWNEQCEQGAIDSSGNDATDNQRIRPIGYIPIVGSTSFYCVAPTNLDIYYYDANKTFISVEYTRNNRVFTTPANCKFIRFRCGGSGYPLTPSTYGHDIAILYPSTKTAYIPYNPNSTEYTIDLGQTCYGGYVDWNEGKLVVTYAIVDMGNVTWNIRSEATDTFYHTPTGAKILFKGACSCYPKVLTSASALGDKEWTSRGGNNLSFWFRDTDFDNYTGEQVASALTGQKFIYELATPIEISLPATMPSTIEGVQNWFADSGDIEVSFKQGILDYND